MTFRDRQDAGARLARRLERLRRARPVVLGLARGGVPVALEVARALGFPLDVIVVRKLGAPGSPEYALGAIAEGGGAYLREEALAELGLEAADLAALAREEAVELGRRVRAYRGDRPALELAGRTVILVDDGIATGATAHAAARAARARGAAGVVVAAPVMSRGAAAELLADADEVVAVERPEPFVAVGAWFERFGQVSDDEVVACLDAARRTEAAGRGPGDASVTIPLPGGRPPRRALEADLVVPPGASGLVVFVHGSGSSRKSPRNRRVAEALRRTGLGTVLLDLLTPDEAAEDEITAGPRFDVALLAGRVIAVTRWLSAQALARDLPLGLFGASTGAAAALGAAAVLQDRVAAVASRGGRPDLVPASTLEAIRAPVLLVVGGADEAVLRLNRSVLPHLALAELAVVPGATHLFEEPGALEAVSRLAASWFGLYLRRPVEPRPGAGR